MSRSVADARGKVSPLGRCDRRAGVGAVVDLCAHGPHATGAGAGAAEIPGGDADRLRRPGRRGHAGRRAGRSSAGATATVAGRRATRAQGSAVVAARVPAARIGQAETAAALGGDDAGIAGRRAAFRAGSAAHRARGVGATGRTRAALVGFHAQLADDAAMIGDPARRLRAAAVDVAHARAAGRAGGAALLLGLAAGHASTPVRAVRRRSAGARAAFLVFHAQREHRPAACQRLTPHRAAGHGGAPPAATGVARRAGFTVDPAGAEQTAGHHPTFAAIGAAAPATLLGLGAGLARRAAVRNHRAHARHAGAAAAILRDGARGSGGAAAGASANAAGAPERAAAAGVRAGLSQRRTTGRDRADARPRPGGIRCAEERTAVCARGAGHAFRPTGSRRAAPIRASARAAVLPRRTGAAVAGAVDDR